MELIVTESNCNSVVAMSQNMNVHTEKPTNLTLFNPRYTPVDYVFQEEEEEARGVTRKAEIAAWAAAVASCCFCSSSRLAMRLIQAMRCFCSSSAVIQP